MSYYKRFRIVIGTSLFRKYLRWVYDIHIQDLKKLEYTPKFEKESFTSLLCGVGNEGTADEFIKFTYSKNPNSRIYIINIAEEQIGAVKKLVQSKYSTKNIVIKQINALNLGQIFNKVKIDWIETDMFLEFFNKEQLEKMLSVWWEILSKDGYISTRVLVYQSPLEWVIDNLRIVIGKLWLGIDTYSYKEKYFDSLLNKQKFLFNSFPMVVPTVKRYSLIKNKEN